MAYEFGQVEGNFENLDERKLKSAIPHGMNYRHFIDKLKQGELALLTHSPASPVLCRNGLSKSWSLSSQGQAVLSPEAKSTFMSRAKLARSAKGSAGGFRSAGYTPSIDATYTPEPIRPDNTELQPTLEFEYCFEVACSDKVFKQRVGCEFQLAKTKQEQALGRWEQATTEHGTKYTTKMAVDEPKQLVAKVAAYSMGISIPERVKVHPIESSIIEEAFIPVVPSVQLGERLGLPTQGYYYHFHNCRLVQEYKLLGDKKWAFYATCSTHDKLNDEQGFNIVPSAILVYWKLGGKEVEGQRLVYLEQQITCEELDDLNDNWLEQNGIKLDIQQLLDVPKQSVADRTNNQNSQSESEDSLPQTHTVQLDKKSNQRESWSAIAESYGVSAKQLLEFNPNFDADPLSLKAGDILTVQNPTEVEKPQSVMRELPPVEPEFYNQASNSHYAYSGNFQGTSVTPINSEDMLPSELAVVNLTAIAPQDVDDVYLIFADKKMSIEDFAQETYLSSDSSIIEHVLSSNPHLKRSFSQILEGMPLVVSPWVEKHPDETFAIDQANELMDEFLKLSSEEKKWFAQHHETTTNALLVSAVSGLDVYQGEASSSNLSEFNLNHVIAGSGAVVAGAQVQGDKLSKKMKSFAEYSKYIAEKTKGLSGQALYSNTDYKAWRKEARTFQGEMKGVLSELGNPGYIKKVQAKRINDYLNVGKRQLYRAKDFSKAISGIEMTALYKQAMSFSKMASSTSWLVVGIGLYGNANDIYQTCNVNGIVSEACGRSATRNIVSGGINAAAGYAIGYGLGLMPVTGGLSIVLVGVGAFLWGMQGGEVSNQIGGIVEDFVFD
ncbi:LysM peptidoglycan-binding domain-containing protein [Vibrio hepatarius]|uniref:LysM peptidoglycan-binding domain-containing protein n=1 Tax=Vibrio hepatarius TaxID=171383 RepID=UPI001C09F242|nr:LysM peptidoglycan-binding domain-containing protein [Vibrio hepatarius]MBU2899069.1 LysM peptidoglycan-binding domain-containing protein [Vibrio hepatarius]